MPLPIGANEMNVIEIPIASATPHFVQDNEVFGRVFHLEFEWIESQGFWMLHVAGESHQPLTFGTKLQPEWPIYIHQVVNKPFTLMLLARAPGQILGRQNLSRHFTLVAYETI